MTRINFWLAVLGWGICHPLQAQTEQFIDLTPQLPMQAIGSRTMDVEAADLDQDGDLDLVLAKEVQKNWILWNDGTGQFYLDSTTFFPQVKTYPQGFQGEDSEDVAIFDADQDGDLDLLFVTEDTDLHEFFLNDGTGHFSLAPYQFPHPAKSNAVLVWDHTGDGFPDVLIGQNGQNALYVNQQDGSFLPDTSGIFPPNTDWTQDLVLADVNADGRPDLVEGCDQGQSNLYIQQSDGTFLETPLPASLANTETRKVVVGDVEGDGDLDIFLCNVGWNPQANPQDLLLINDGQGHFTDETAARFPYSLVIALDGTFHDFNADGLPDLLVTGDGGLQNFYTYLNDPTNPGHFQATLGIFPFFVMSTCIGLTHGDFSGDGSEDFYFAVFQGADRLLSGHSLTSLDETSMGGIPVEVYPNPVEDQLFLTETLLRSCSIVDMAGQVVMEDIPLVADLPINVSSLKPGGYVLLVGGRHAVKFIKA
ncbi:T9SS type A sorting domain-containing protein [Pontibacter sp. G13]|uniref:T9SS type A sorting domain-containing protein n=1 Tax=Pontibacter sp. G13 TaxID=3074898 RepID=UPI00288946E9|nr:T9SS type A sorting domain-containing protein [Pontibacter sp. G13]WNJ20557.1 T9SS type A sorting domain-containing protein [Pontibacter sp. G13]